MLLNVVFLFLIHLKLALLTKSPTSNDRKYILFRPLNLDIASAIPASKDENLTFDICQGKLCITVDYVTDSSNMTTFVRWLVVVATGPNPV